MKKLLFVLTLMLMTLTAVANEIVLIDGIYYILQPKGKIAIMTRNPSDYILTPDGLLDANRLTYVGDVIIPETVIQDNVEYIVTSIGQDAFRNCQDMTSVVIPNTVTSIGFRAFYWCHSLVFVVFPDALLSIGDHAFDGCFKLTEAAIPNSVVSIGESAFSSCKSLKSLTIPSGVNTIADFCFGGLESMTSLVIPNTVTVIGKRAFAACTSLTSLSLPSSLTTLGEGALAGCTGLTSIDIPISVNAIGCAAFDGCNNLTSVHISDLEAWFKISFEYDISDELDFEVSTNPLYYAKHLFLNGEEITELSIPDGVTSIGKIAFLGWKSMVSVNIPNSVTTIGTGAFYECDGLTSVTIPNSVKSIGCEAFMNCDALETVTIGNGVETITDRAFSWCPNLKDVYCLPKNVPTILKGKPYTPDIFFYSDIESAMLYVPESALEAYKRAWTGFKAYVPLDETVSIGNDVSQNDEVNKNIFDLQGRRVLQSKMVKKSQNNSLPKGIYIQNGKKVVVN